MKTIRLFFATLLAANFALGQNITLQKVPADNTLTATSKVLVVPSGGSLTATGTGTIVATGGTATTVPWSGVTGTPTTLTDYGITNTLSTTSPITGGGTLASNLTLAIPASTGSVNGYLTSTDWTTFNSKQGAITPSTALTAGSLTLALSPLGVTSGGTGLVVASLGDFLYGSGTNTRAALPGNTSSTLAVLTQTGTGTVSAAPAWLATTGTGNVARATSPTLTTPVFSSIVNTGTLTLPTATDTLVGRATTDTLTNKSISGATNTLTAIPNGALGNSTITIGTTSVALGSSTLTPAGLTSVGVNSVTAAASTDLTLTGGSTGASLVLGQGTNGGATTTLKGTGLATWAGASKLAQLGDLPAVTTYQALALGTNAAPLSTVVYSIASNGADTVLNTPTSAGTLQFNSGGTEHSRFSPINHNLLIGGTTDITGSGGLKVFGSTASTSTTTGALQVAGGVGVVGDLFAASVTAKTAAANSFLVSTASAGQIRALALQTAGVSRWLVYANTSAESGANAGSNFQLAAYDDGGSVIDSPISITRAAGGTMTLPRPISITNATPSTSTNTGALQVAGGVGVAGAVFVGGIVTTTSTTLSGAGAIPITTSLVKFTSTGAAQALTLANGVDGQRLTIVHDVAGGSGVLTPTTKKGFSTVTFTNAGDTVSLVYVTTRGWMVTGSYLATIAP